MDRVNIIKSIGEQYWVYNDTEKSEWSYIQDAGSRKQLDQIVGKELEHVRLDIRFKLGDVVVLVETKYDFNKGNELDKHKQQLSDYVTAEKALHPTHKIIAILANTKNDKIMVWRNSVDDVGFLPDETVIDTMEHYVKIFTFQKQNDRERVLKNTYALNELLHKYDIPESLRSQFVGTALLYIKALAAKAQKDLNTKKIDASVVAWCQKQWEGMIDASEVISGVTATLSHLLNKSQNKDKKVKLLQKNVLSNQKIQQLSLHDWTIILTTILKDIYCYINTDSDEGQDILNLFFIAFNKYTGKADKNQAFTPDHITDFMCRLTDINRDTVVLDATCGSGSFLVQAMVKELADCSRNTTDAEAERLRDSVKSHNIYGIEVEEKAYGLATTNMLIHGDGNSNIMLGSCFDTEATNFIIEAAPDVFLMNPPYNAKPKSIPEKYKKDWPASAKDGKEEPTKGLVFVHYLSDVVQEMNDRRRAAKLPVKTVKLAVLLPVSAAIGTKSIIADEKNQLLEENTLEAVFTLPNEIFYPGASVCACCMLFTLGQPHFKDGKPRTTFFGYYKEDNFKKKKNLGRVEQFNEDGTSKWKQTETEWLDLFESKSVVDGLSAKATVTGDDEWLCEAYMKTDYSQLTTADFQQTINNYLSYLVKEGCAYES